MASDGSILLIIREVKKVIVMHTRLAISSTCVFSRLQFTVHSPSLVSCVSNLLGEISFLGVKFSLKMPEIPNEY